MRSVHPGNDSPAFSGTTSVLRDVGPTRGMARIPRVADGAAPMVPGPRRSPDTAAAGPLPV
ncbi:hypothetical protein [uncultured Friedmanniella sp.]|uniref:hypothetical protein n=1 Tax=uncultured Friedmanniella sp. TaxID=335381 RepID=UPI0035CB9B73